MTPIYPSATPATTPHDALRLELVNLRARLLRAEHYLYTRAPDAGRRFPRRSPVQRADGYGYLRTPKPAAVDSRVSSPG